MNKSAVLLLLVAFGVSAQFPGQYPPGGGYPPGQYPPGQDPGGQMPGGGGISLPSRHKKSKPADNAAAQPTFAADGETVSHDGKKLVIHTADGRWLTMTLNEKTKWTRSGSDIQASKIVPRTTVHIEALEDDEAFLTAVQVNLLKDVPAEEQQTTAERHAAAKPADDDELTRPTILHDSVNVPDRPILRHGKPKISSGDDDDATTVSSAKTAPPAKANVGPSKQASQDGDFSIDDKPVEAKHAPGAELLDRTKEWAGSFTGGLPNFVCQQFTTRYSEVSRSEGWQAQDVVTAKVLYEDGKEAYGDITVSGKKTSKTMMDLGGTTSTGEFASMLASLFDPGRATEFKFYRSATQNGSDSAIYDFKVTLPRSDWTISIGGQLLRPAYSGSVWVDKATAQVRRIELQADKVPKDFPMDAIQSAIDYEEVSLGTTKYLLPTHAENLSCQRGSTYCTKNTIDFRDYHKYSGESTVVFK